MIQSQVAKQVPISIQQKEVQSKPLVEHPGITCTICSAEPLLGTRYVCLESEEMNICEKCELQEQYSKTHAMIIIQEP